MRAPTSGFTLLEMLVAVAIFALASALAYGGLDGLMRARAQLDATQERLGRVQFALGLLERDLRGAVARPVRDNYGARQPALVGQGDRLEVTRGGYSNALGQPRAELERVAWRLLDDTLQRRRYGTLDRTAGSVPADDDLLDDVQAVQLRYLGDGGRESTQWPPPQGASTPLPRAVELRVTLADLGELRRVFELPRDSTP